MNQARTRDTPVDVTPAFIPLPVVTQLTRCITACHAMRKGKTVGSVSGSHCLSCEHFAGLTSTRGETGEAWRDYRGACEAVRNRRVTDVDKDGERFGVVHCPEAPVKVDGAKRFGLIKSTHCVGCEYNAGETKTGKGGVFIHCTARKGIRYERTYLED